MICHECDLLLESFQRATLDFISHVHYLRWPTEVENYPHQFEKERQQERDLEMALHQTMEELNNHLRMHRQEKIRFVREQSDYALLGKFPLRRTL